MATGATYANITTKRILGDTDFGERFLTYLRDSQREQAAVVHSQGGVHGSLSLSATAIDQFQIDGTDLASDGLGHLLDISQGTYEGIQFENSNTIPYYVAIGHCEKPVSVAANPRNGLPEYTAFMDEIGEKAAPDAVVDNGGNITFTVNGITESGVDNSGRQVLVYKVVPAPDALTTAIAIETATVVYSGGNNQITTVGTLGQSTVSTTPSDYLVILLGPAVKRNTDLRTSTTHAFIGIVNGAGVGVPPFSFDVSDQNQYTTSLSQINEITRLASNGRLKIEVKAIAGETAEDQIRVKDSSGTINFKVDEAGNVTIEGDLEVKGTTTQRDVVQTIANETITQNLTVGDSNSDFHTAKGTWRHTDTTGTSNHFYVDGTTGRIGMGTVPDATHTLKVSGDTEITGTLTPNLIDVLTLSTAAGEGVASDVLPDSGAVRSLGSATRRWSLVATHDLNVDNTAGRGVANHLVPTTDSTWNIGEAGRRFGTVFADSLSIDANFYQELSLGDPTIHVDANDELSYDRTGNVFRFTINSNPVMTVSSSVVYTYTGLYPSATDTHVLGGSALRWLNSYITTLNTNEIRPTGTDISIEGSLVPVTTNTIDLGSASKWWQASYATTSYVGDANQFTDISGNLARWNVQNTNNDRLTYDRVNKIWAWDVANAPLLRVRKATATSGYQMVLGGTGSGPADDGILVRGGLTATRHARLHVASYDSMEARVRWSATSTEESGAYYEQAWVPSSQLVYWRYGTTNRWELSLNTYLAPVTDLDLSLGQSDQRFEQIWGSRVYATNTTDTAPSDAKEATMHSGLNSVLATGNVVNGTLTGSSWNVTGTGGSAGQYSISLSHGVDANNWSIVVTVKDTASNVAYAYHASRTSAQQIAVKIWTIATPTTSPTWSLANISNWSFAIIGRPDGL